MDELQQRDAIALERIQELEGEVRAGEGRKQQVDLLEREVGFCKALVVCPLSVFVYLSSLSPGELPS